MRPPHVEFVVESDAESAAARAAGLLCELARRGGTVVLAGGSTPRRAYELAAALEPDWSRVALWLGDERHVPADDERSNRQLVSEALLYRLEAGPETHWVPTELPVSEAAVAYAEALGGVQLDLVLLGIGSDGHTASLFPGSPALAERGNLAVAAKPGLAPWVDRVTLTIPALESAAHVVFLAVGADKAEPVRRAFADPPSFEVPASLVRSRAGSTTAILDRAAATRL